MTNKKIGLGMLAIMLVFGMAVPAGLAAQDFAGGITVTQVQMRNYSVKVSGLNRNGHRISMQYSVRAESASVARSEGISRFLRANPGATSVTASVEGPF
jgi:hypothetical protein